MLTCFIKSIILKIFEYGYSRQIQDHQCEHKLLCWACSLVSLLTLTRINTFETDLNLHIHNISISTWKPWWFTHFTLFLVHFLFSCEHFFTLIGPHTPPFLWRREPYSKLLKYPPILLSTLKSFLVWFNFNSFEKWFLSFFYLQKSVFMINNELN